jgi:hypothetical protein
VRRWFLLFMLIVLPLQFATAAAASYCRHESNATSKHYGHHEHEHQTPAEGSGLKAPADDSSSGTAGSGDPDCEYCHLAASYPLLQASSPTRAIVGHAPATDSVASFGSRGPDALDRPNWNSLA